QSESLEIAHLAVPWPLEELSQIASKIMCLGNTGPERRGRLPSLEFVRRAQPIQGMAQKQDRKHMNIFEPRHRQQRGVRGYCNQIRALMDELGNGDGISGPRKFLGSPPQAEIMREHFVDRCARIFEQVVVEQQEP